MSATRQQWQLILRRAYEIPDAVSDESALTVIARIFVKQHLHADTLQAVASPEGLFREVIEIVLDMFTKSAFDVRLLPEALREHLDDQQNIIHEVLSKLRDNGLNWPRPTHQPPTNEVTSAVTEIVNTLCDYNIANPKFINISRT
jgi:hypothetical protein